MSITIKKATCEDAAEILQYLKQIGAETDNLSFGVEGLPLTVKHATEALLEAGFSSVEVLKNWGATYTIKAVK